MTNPKKDNFIFPFEGLKHEGTIILLPYREDTWEDKGLKAFDEFKNVFNIDLSGQSDEDIYEDTITYIQNKFDEHNLG